MIDADRRTARQILIDTLVTEFAQVPEDQGDRYDELADLTQKLEQVYPGFTNDLEDALEGYADENREAASEQAAERGYERHLEDQGYEAARAQDAYEAQHGVVSFQDAYQAACPWLFTDDDNASEYALANTQI